MRSPLAPALVALLSIPVLAPTSAAQCGGQGVATFEFVSKDNMPIGPGSDVILRLTGKPNTFFCLICDFGKGPVEVPTIGTFCLDLSQNLVEFVEQIPASGVLDIPVKFPRELTSEIVFCCQWFGIEPTSRQISLSNQSCICLNTECEGGVNELRYVTKIRAPSQFPATIVSSYRKKDLGETFGRTSVSFDPANPPRFPIQGSGNSFIEKITLQNGELHVVTRVSQGFDKDQEARKFPTNDTAFVLDAGGRRVSDIIHLSCSKPIGVGMVFGPHTILNMTPVDKAEGKCEGGVNELCYETSFDAPSRYPVRIVSRAGKKDGKEFFYSTDLDYNPASPPRFPVTDDGFLFIDDIKIENGKLVVCSRVSNGIDNKNKRRKFPETDTLFQVKSGSSTNQQVIHLSCSKPIRIGSMFGRFRIKCLTSVK